MYRACVNFTLLLSMVALVSCGGDGGEDEESPAAEAAVVDSADTAASVLSVVSTSPPRGSMGIPRDVQISVNFNEDVDPRTVTDSSFMLIMKDFLIPGTITWLENVVTFTPVSPLAPDTTYTVRVTTAVRDLDENPLPLDYIWSFTTSSALSSGIPQP